MIAEGDLVAAHPHYKTFNMAAVDIWRFDEDGRMIEHWDVLQLVPEATASGNDMFSCSASTSRRVRYATVALSTLRDRTPPSASSLGLRESGRGRKLVLEREGGGRSP